MMSDLNDAALAFAADLMQMDVRLGLVPAIKLAEKDDESRALHASRALKTYLNFPRGTCREWEAGRPRAEVISTLRVAANSIPKIECDASPSTCSPVGR